MDAVVQLKEVTEITIAPVVVEQNTSDIIISLRLVLTLLFNVIQE